MRHPYTLSLKLYALGIACLASEALFAEEILVLNPLVVEDETPHLSPRRDSSLREVRYIEDLSLQNQGDAIDLLRYLPNISVTKPDPAANDALIAIRDQSAFANGRVWVMVDGLPLSNLIESGPGGAPRLNAVQPHDIDSIEVLYGPFSAEYGGYALSGVVAYQTKPIRQRSGSLSAQYLRQDFDLYGTSGVYEGYRSQARYEDRFGKLGLALSASQTKNESQPARFISTTALTSPPPPPPPPPASPPSIVAGAFSDLDPASNERVIFGSNGPRESLVNTLSLQAEYDWTDRMTVHFTSRFTQRESSQESPENYLQSGGLPVWQGTVIFEGQQFTVRPNAFAHNRVKQEQILNGIGLDGVLENEWHYQLNFSAFHTLELEDMRSNQNPEDPLFDNSGRVRTSPSTYWLNAKGTFTKDAFFEHEAFSLLFGYEFNRANFKELNYNSDDWNSGSQDDFSSARGGQTNLYSGFVALEWQANPRSRVVLGLRGDSWSADSGFAEAVDIPTGPPGGPPSGPPMGPPPPPTPGPPSVTRSDFPSRQESSLSPKFTFEHELNEASSISFNAAQTQRFPLALELFQESRNEDGEVIQGNPNLRPEESTMVELSWKYKGPKNHIRLTAFRNEIDDAILSLTSAPGAGMPTREFVNIDRVVSHGLEFSYSQRDVFFDRLDGSLNIGYTDSTIETYRNAPEVEGNTYPGVPEWRINGTLRYRLNRALELGFGARYQSHSFNQLDNSDTRDTFGSNSQFLVFDFSTRYKIQDDLTLTLRVDNLLDEEYFANRTLPQRNISLGAEWQF